MARSPKLTTLQCSCSLIAGKMAQNKLQAVVDANSLLRFAKKNSDITLQYEPIPMNDFSDHSPGDNV